MNSWHGLITVTGQMPRRYRDLRERTERQQRRREEFIERLLEQQRERSLHSFRRPSAADTESIEGAGRGLKRAARSAASRLMDRTLA